MKLGLYVFRSSHILKIRVSCTHANRSQQRKYKMRVSVLYVFSEKVFLCKYHMESSKYSKKTIFKWPHDFSNRNNISINLTHIILLYIITVSGSFKGPNRVFWVVQSPRSPHVLHYTLEIETFYLANFFNVNFWNINLYYTYYVMCHSLYWHYITLYNIYHYYRRFLCEWM